MKTIPYKVAREKFKRGDCLAWCGIDLVSKAISLKTGSPVTHISVIIDEVQVGKWSPAGRNLRNKAIIRWQQIEAGGEDVLFVKVGLNYVSERLKAYDGSVIWYKLHPDLDEYRPDIVTELLVQVGKGYDYSALIMSLFGRPLFDSATWACSELAEHGYKSMPLRAFQKHPEWFKDPEFRTFISDQMSWPPDIAGLPFLIQQGVLLA